MSISSMTGFGRATGQEQSFCWTWEVKSVNAKGLDVRVRVPGLVDGLDVAARQKISSQVERGSVTATLSLSRQPGHETIVVKESALEELVALSARLSTKSGVSPAGVAGLLSVGGIVDVRDAQLDEADLAGLKEELMAGLDGAIDALSASRRIEGKGLAKVLLLQLDKIADATRRAAAHEGATATAIRDRLMAKIEELMDSEKAPDQERMAQEIALLAVKADIREEIDRLGLHVESARALLGQDEAIGRRLEFIAQELVREANTLCSKSAHMELTNIGLELKTAIDRFREQLQNVE